MLNVFLHRSEGEDIPIPAVSNERVEKTYIDVCLAGFACFMVFIFMYWKGRLCDTHFILFFFFFLSLFSMGMRILELSRLLSLLPDPPLF